MFGSEILLLVISSGAFGLVSGVCLTVTLRYLGKPSKASWTSIPAYLSLLVVAFFTSLAASALLAVATGLECGSRALFASAARRTVHGLSRSHSRMISLRLMRACSYGLSAFARGMQFGSWLSKKGGIWGVACTGMCLSMLRLPLA